MRRTILTIGLFFFLGVTSVYAQAFTAGEKIAYNIKKMGLRVGRAVITYSGVVSIEGRNALLIEVRSKGVQFIDDEKIYLDPQTFYPIVVQRDINILGKKEKIREAYDQENGIVHVIKDVGGEEVRLKIEKTAPIENIYGFIFRYRQTGTFEIGEQLEIRLPTKGIAVTLKEKAMYPMSDEKVEAVHLRSNPRGYDIWFRDDTTRIPLRIDGAIGFGKTAMVFSEYLLE